MLFLLGMITSLCLFSAPKAGVVFSVSVQAPLGGVIPISFCFDPVRVGFLCVLSFAAATCHGFSSRYLAGVAPRRLYFLFYSLFYCRMVGFIFAGDLLTVFIFWDSLGISSFFLVSLFRGSQARAGGALTVITNRLGDMIFIVGAAWLWGGGRRLWVRDLGASSLAARCLICLGLFCKSAQWPLSGWLPAAMSAPTPVSALVHSSTLVTAGVYLLIRWSPLAPRYWLVGLSAATFFWGAVGALLSYDLKRVIAISTLSHLGVITLILFRGYPSLAYFHLLRHALFKSNRFLAGGALILGFKHTQDIRYMGQGWGSIALTKSALLVCL